MDGDDVHLSAATIAALKEFAMARGIVEDDDYEGEMDEEEGNEADIIERVRRHYEVKDRDEVFQFKYGDIEFSLKGVKRELGQTLSSTGW
jgi:formaldehyde-activating enzyme involved in methanogenesis